MKQENILCQVVTVIGKSKECHCIIQPAGRRQCDTVSRTKKRFSTVLMPDLHTLECRFELLCNSIAFSSNAATGQGNVLLFIKWPVDSQVRFSTAVMFLKHGHTVIKITRRNLFPDLNKKQEVKPSEVYWNGFSCNKIVMTCYCTFLVLGAACWHRTSDGREAMPDWWC